jgi:hypothetical protein
LLRPNLPNYRIDADGKAGLRRHSVHLAEGGSSDAPNFSLPDGVIIAGKRRPNFSQTS